MGAEGTEPGVLALDDKVGLEDAAPAAVLPTCKGLNRSVPSNDRRGAEDAADAVVVAGSSSPTCSPSSPCSWSAADRDNELLRNGEDMTGPFQERRCSDP